MNTQFYIGGLVDSTHTALCATVEEARGQMEEWIDEEDFEPGTEVRYSVWAAKTPLDVTYRTDQSRLFLGDTILEQVDCDCADDCGAEDTIFHLSKEERQELGSLIVNFIRERSLPNWYSFGEEQFFTYTIPEHDRE